MRIIYLSCHAILEFDEVKLLTELGHDVFCLGDFGSNERPLVTGRDRKCDWLTEHEIKECCRCGQGNLPESVIEKADMVISMHLSHWLTEQWDSLRRKKCLLRLIGQHSAGLGTGLRPYTDDGLKVIPYWKTDAQLNGLSNDQMTPEVRFYKDEDEFCGWTGEKKMILTACNDIMRGGGQACHARQYQEATNGLPRLLVGKKNRFFGDYTARVPYWMLKEFYKTYAIYFFVGTEPATYILNLIEAMMTGIPVVAFDTGAAKELAGFASTDPQELNEVLEDALNDRIDVKPWIRRDLAIQLFGKQQAMEVWRKVLE